MRTPQGKVKVGPRRAEQQGTGRAIEALAEAELERRKTQRREGRHVEASRPVYTVRAYTEIVWATKTRRASSDNVIRRTAEQWLALLGDLRLDAVTTEDVRRAWGRITAEERFGASTQQLIFSSLRQVFRAAEREGLIEYCPVYRSGVKPPPPPEKRGRRHKPIELRPFFEVLAERFPQHRAAFVLQWTLGMRIGEAIAVRGCDIVAREDGAWLVLPQTKTVPRDVPLSTWHVDLLESHRLAYRDGAPDEEPLFGKPGTMRGAFNVARAAAGLPELQPHDLRRAFIASASQLGVRVAVVKAIVGHADRDITERYDGTWTEELRTAIEDFAEVAAAALASSLSPPVSPLDKSKSGKTRGVSDG